MRPTGSAAELARRRRGAVIRLRKGERVIDVAASLGVSTTAVQNWKRAAAEGGGLRALRAKPQHVLTCRLSADQKRELRKILVRVPLRRATRPTFGRATVWQRSSSSSSASRTIRDTSAVSFTTLASPVKSPRAGRASGMRRR
jgi:hypothetical protein